MKSPFPGMDPFLEDPAWWSDFHSRFINAWCERVADALPEGYEASLGDHVYLVEHDPDARKLGFPDIAVTHGERLSLSAASQAGTATLEPVTIPVTILEGPRQTYIEILHQPDRSLVAVLELLSPANKEQPGRIEYLAKQDVHLVELDLLVGGRRLPMERPLPPADYYYLLCRSENRLDSQVYHWTVRDPVPTLPVPLRAPDGDIHVNLAEVFNTAYERGRFARRINYGGQLPVFLSHEDRQWAESLLKRRP